MVMNPWFGSSWTDGAAVGAAGLMQSKLPSTWRVRMVMNPWFGSSWTAVLRWVLRTNTTKLPSTWRVSNGHEPVVRLLLDRGAAVGAAD